jgi:hypothetical protein
MPYIPATHCHLDCYFLCLGLGAPLGNVLDICQVRRRATRSYYWREEPVLAVGELDFSFGFSSVCTTSGMIGLNWYGRGNDGSYFCVSVALVPAQVADTGRPHASLPP